MCFREFEQQRELREKGLLTTDVPTSPDESFGGINNQMDKVWSFVISFSLSIKRIFVIFIQILYFLFFFIPLKYRSIPELDSKKNSKGSLCLKK